MSTELKHVTGAQLAIILGVSRSTVSNLAASGIIPRVERGLFDLPAAVQSYLKHRLEQAKAAGDDAGVKNLMTERARLARLKADAEERAAKVEAGELVPAADIERVWFAVAAMVRSRLLTIPTKIAPRIASKAPAEVQSALRAEINAALSELSTSAPAAV